MARQNIAPASWSAAVLCRFQSRSPFAVWLEVVGHIQLVDFESINRFYDRRRGRALEPGCGTPRIEFRHRNQTMPSRVLMNVIQTRKIGLVIGEFALPVIIPDFPTRSLIETIHPGGCFRMQYAQHVGQIRCVWRIVWGVTDEVIMVRENGPGFQTPAEITRYR